jgi:ABC-type uncharacterized transport system permease subunit
VPEGGPSARHRPLWLLTLVLAVLVVLAAVFARFLVAPLAVLTAVYVAFLVVDHRRRDGPGPPRHDA